MVTALRPLSAIAATTALVACSRMPEPDLTVDSMAAVVADTVLTAMRAWQATQTNAVCLTQIGRMDAQTDPSAHFIGLLKTASTSVLPSTHCTIDSTGTYVKGTRQPAAHLALRIFAIGADTAVGEGSFSSSETEGAGWQCQLHRSVRGWEIGECLNTHVR